MRTSKEGYEQFKKLSAGGQEGINAFMEGAREVTNDRSLLSNWIEIAFFQLPKQDQTIVLIYLLEKLGEPTKSSGFLGRLLNR